MQKLSPSSELLLHFCPIIYHHLEDRIKNENL